MRNLDRIGLQVTCSSRCTLGSLRWMSMSRMKCERAAPLHAL